MSTIAQESCRAQISHYGLSAFVGLFDFHLLSELSGGSCMSRGFSRYLYSGVGGLAELSSASPSCTIYNFAVDDFRECLMSGLYHLDRHPGVGMVRCGGKFDGLIPCGYHLYCAVGVKVGETFFTSGGAGFLLNASYMSLGGYG